MPHPTAGLLAKLPTFVANIAGLGSSLGLALLLGACFSPGTGEVGTGETRQAHPELDEPPALRSVDPPAGPGAMAPRLTHGRKSTDLTWLEPDATGGHTLYLSSLRDEVWTPALAIITGGRFFANWADLPAITTATDGTRFAHWLQKLGDDTYAYGVALATSKDDEADWREIGWLHDDSSPTEHGFVSYVPLPSGGVQAFWLDGRAMAGDGAGVERGAMQLRTATLNQAGPGPSQILDPRVCECCSTDAALTAAGPVVVYRDRDPSEIRDIAVVRATAAGWSRPALIHRDGWEIHGCPVNGPAIGAAGNRVAVAWFSAPGNRARVAVAFSEDAGASFGEPILIDAETPIGRVDVVLDSNPDSTLAPSAAFVSWISSAGEQAGVRWRRVDSTGEIGPTRQVASTTSERSSGVPRMIGHGDSLLFTWVEAGEPSQLRAGLVSPR